MQVIFVRHGQTDGNIARRHQHHDTPLNAHGRTQSEAVAILIQDLRPTHIFSSSQLRAVETTRIIVSRCHELIPEMHGVFEELRRPDEIIAQRYMSFRTIWFTWSWFRGVDKKGGESYRDFIKRIVKARTHLEALPPGTRVVVVSHAIFINIFLQQLHSDQPMNLLAAIGCIWKIYKMQNTKITKLEYQADAAQGRQWRVIE